MKLHVLPISSYAQKTLMAFYEMGVAFERILVNVLDPAESAAFRRLTPLGKNPLLELADGRRIVESSIIIEYVDQHENKGRRLIPDDPEAALEVRLRDRFADLYFNTPMSKLAQDPRLPVGENDPRGVRLAKATLDTMFAMTDGDLAQRAWIAGEAFSMADCAMAPALSYLSEIRSFDAYPNLAAYAARLLARPSYARVSAEAAPFMRMLAGATPPPAPSPPPSPPRR
jgi:glutathione S-transferase